MSEISEEERQRRIVATENNPWVQLALAGREEWNGFMRYHKGKDWWANMIDRLPSNYSEESKKNLCETEPMIASTYTEWIFKLKVQERAKKLFVHFNNSIFENQSLRLDFSEFVFPDRVHFFNCRASYEICFQKCIFYDEANFINMVFASNVLFSAACFFSNARFQNTKFEGYSEFNAVDFKDEARFDSAEFTGNVYFDMVKFHKDVYFRRTIFNQEAQFRGVKFQNIPTFIGSEFRLFINFKKYKDETDRFHVTEFKHPPHFEGVDCDAIYINEAIFQKPYFDNYSLEASASAWAALVRLMEKVHNLPMRQEFYERLLEVEKHYPTEKSAKWLYNIHFWMGAGKSACVPFCWWALFNAVFFLLYYSFAKNSLQAFSFSLMNSIPFVTTFNRQIIQPFLDSNGHVEPGLILGAGIHTFLSMVCIFFIGLALRNRFKMK